MTPCVVDGTLRAKKNNKKTHTLSYHNELHLEYNVFKSHTARLDGEDWGVVKRVIVVVGGTGLRPDSKNMHYLRGNNNNVNKTPLHLVTP